MATTFFPSQHTNTKASLYLQLSSTEVCNDYKLAVLSRETSLLGRREVLTGKAKFGILGDGKELPQLILAKVFQKGDFRSGYYRDQTLMMALGKLTLEQFFAQLYADPDLNNEPHSGGRQMNSHFATPFVKPNGQWHNLMQTFNTSADISCTAGQMSRAVGLALASKQYRCNNELKKFKQRNLFTNNGNEVTFVTIGDASTTEGVFWEAVNAAGVLRIPLAIFIWDDGYGISVPTKYQTTKGSISQILEGFKRNEQNEGYDIYQINGWDYEKMYKIIPNAVQKIRDTHMPAIFHIKELTQPQGHSTSGSHERYKSKERLIWEKKYDCITQMRKWILNNKYATEQELILFEKEAKTKVRDSLKRAWANFNTPIKQKISELSVLYDKLISETTDKQQTIVRATKIALNKQRNPVRANIAESLRGLLFKLRYHNSPTKKVLIDWLHRFQNRNKSIYNTHLYSESPKSPLRIAPIPPTYSQHSTITTGYNVLNACFDAALKRDPRILAFGEDVGQIGDVNQGFAGLQEKYGTDRVFDTGIREQTIIGQGIGMAMRGLRPIAEIQYIDYFIYAIQTVSDDLATLRYRSAGQQQAPLIIRTRGHRLEGIWHSGSPMGMLLNTVRGIHLCVPRNMVQAAGMYNTLLQGDDPAIVVECLNGYRLKEKQPDNIGTFTVELGVPETIKLGTDITLVTYGSCCRIVQAAAKYLQEEADINCEIIDVQTLLPFDRHHHIVRSIQKTNRLLVIDEDVPGGASAYILQKILEKQQAYQWLDSAPATLSAQAHRPAYGSDGDYYSKPNKEDVIEKVYAIMHESNPKKYPDFC